MQIGHFGLSFKWKFASQWCVEVYQNGIDKIKPHVPHMQKKIATHFVFHRLMPDPLTGGCAFWDSLQIIAVMLSSKLVIQCCLNISLCSTPTAGCCPIFSLATHTTWDNSHSVLSVFCCFYRTIIFLKSSLFILCRIFYRVYLQCFWGVYTFKLIKVTFLLRFLHYTKLLYP